MARVLVTGASGFVGAAVVRALVARGDEARVIVRENSSRENLGDIDVEIVLGDLRDAAAVERATRGVETLYHVAADYRLWVPNPAEIVANNLDMTRNVMDAALAAGVRRVVYTSSVATLRPQEDRSPSDETRALGPGEAAGAYKNSKVAAERLVESYVAERGLPAVIVNPSTPIGPRDVKPTPTGRVVLDAARGRIPAFVDTGLNLAHVDDVAAGHLMAADRGKVGERYILGGQNVNLRLMLAEIAGLVGRKPPRIALPRRALFPAAYVNEVYARMTGHEPQLTVDALRMAKRYMFFSSAKAERELGYQARPYKLALADALDWFRATGRLK
jgi:dihydroflavonol-4-reductase